MANAENIRKVIACIEDERNRFDMNLWGETIAEADGQYSPPNICGTPSCIGGWAEAILLHEKGFAKDTKDYCSTQIEELSEWLGLDPDAATHLFYPDNHREAYSATREQSIAHLEHIIETGEVDWSQFVPESEDFDDDDWFRLLASELDDNDDEDDEDDEECDAPEPDYTEWEERD